MRILGWCYLLFLVVVVFLANTGHGWLLEWINHVPMRDKAGHFILVGSGCLALNLILDCRKITLAGHAFLLGTLVMLAIATTEEFSQIWMPHRTFSWADMLANWLGILFFDRLLTYLLYKRRQGESKAAPASLS